MISVECRVPLRDLLSPRVLAIAASINMTTLTAAPSAGEALHLLPEAADRRRDAVEEPLGRARLSARSEVQASAAARCKVAAIRHSSRRFTQR